MFFLFQERTLEISPRTSPRVFPPKGSLFSLKNAPKNRSPLVQSRSLGFLLKKPQISAQNGLKIHPKSTPNVATSCSNVATSFLQLSATSRRRFSRRDVAAAFLFLRQLRKTITLSSEVRFGCSWYRWKAIEVYNLSIYDLIQYNLIYYLITSKYSSLS